MPGPQEPNRMTAGASRPRASRATKRLTPSQSEAKNRGAKRTNSGRKAPLAARLPGHLHRRSVLVEGRSARAALAPSRPCLSTFSESQRRKRVQPSRRQITIGLSYRDPPEPWLEDFATTQFPNGKRRQ